MLEFFNRQSNFVKTLIIAVLVVVLAFIIYQIYKNFIKNAILREAYEDIKIVIESQCPPGYYYDGIVLKCVGCNNIGEAVNSSGNACEICKKEILQVVDGFTEGGVTFGKSCISATPGTVPDPASTSRNFSEDSVIPTVSDSTASNGGTAAVGLLARSNSNNSLFQWLISISRTPVSDVYSEPVGYNPATGAYTRAGTRTTTFTVNCLYSNAYTSNSFPSGGFASIYNASNNTAGKQYVPYLFSDNLKERINRLFYFALFGTEEPSNPPIMSYMFKNSGSNTTYNTSEIVSSTNSGVFVNQIVVTSSWNCGNFTVTPLSEICLGPNSDRMPAGISYNRSSSSNLSFSVFDSKCAIENVPFNDDGTGDGVPCTLGAENCVVRNLSNPIQFTGYPKYDPSNGTYRYTDTYIYDVPQFPNDAVVNGVLVRGNPCEALSFSAPIINPANGQVIGTKNLNPGGASSFGQGEFIYNYENSTVTIQRSCNIKYGSKMFWAGPNSVSLNGFDRPLDYNAPYMNPLYQTNPNSTNNAYVIYKKPLTTGGTTNVSGPLTNGQVPSTCDYSNASLPVLIIYGTYTATNDTEGFNTNNRKRTTIIKAKRNIYETITTDPNNTSDNNIYNYLVSILSGGAGTLNIVSQSQAAPLVIKFMGNQFGKDQLSNATQTASGSQPLTYITTNKPTLGSITITDTTTSAVSASKPIQCCTAVGFGNNKKYLVSAFNSSLNYGGKVYTSTTSSFTPITISTTSPNTFNNSSFGSTNTSKNFSWLACDKTTTGNTLTAVAYGDDIYRSYNGGINWYGSNYVVSGTAPQPVNRLGPNNESGLDRNFSQVCMSNDGVMQFACSFGGHIYFSFDSGYTWNKYTFPGTINPLTSLSSGLNNDSSSDLAAVFNYPQKWSAISCNSTGTIVTAVMGSNPNAATSSGGWLYVATLSYTNSGNTSIPAINASPDIRTPISIFSKASIPTFTWSRPLGVNNQTDTYGINYSSRGWRQVALSSDGKFQTAIISQSFIVRSEDFGVTWSYRNILVNGLSVVDRVRNWTDVKISPVTTNPGMWQVAIENIPTSIFQSTSAIDPNSLPVDIRDDSTGIYYSKDYGLSWTPILSSTNNAVKNPYTLCNIDIDTNNMAYITTTSGTVITLNLNQPSLLTL